MKMASATGVGNGAAAPASRVGKVIIRCGAVTKAGRPCTNAAGPDGHCIAHSRSPQALATVQAARAAGGRAPRVRIGLGPSRGRGRGSARLRGPARSLDGSHEGAGAGFDQLDRGVGHVAAREGRGQNRGGRPGARDRGTVAARRGPGYRGQGAPMSIIFGTARTRPITFPGRPAGLEAGTRRAQAATPPA